MSSNLVIRDMQVHEAAEVAALRLEAKEWGFLASMGEVFFAELFRGACNSKWAFIKVAFDPEKNRVAGFVFGANNINKYYNNIILRRGWKLALLCGFELLKHPRLISGLFQYFRYPAVVPPSDTEAEWLTMVVSADYRGRGIAKQLSLALLEEFRQRGAYRIRSTAAAHNLISCKIHDQLGFQLSGSFWLQGEQLNLYIYNHSTI